MGRLGDGGRIYVSSFNFSLSVTSATKSAAELPSSFFCLKSSKRRADFPSARLQILFFFVKGKLSRSFWLKKLGNCLARAAAACCNQATETESQTSHGNRFGNCFGAHGEVLEILVVTVTAIVKGD